MAYYIFEQISGINHLLESQRIGILEAATYVEGKVPELIQTYSAAPRIQRQLQKKLDDQRRKEKLAMAIVSGALLLASGGLALPGVLAAEATAVPITNMLASTYIGVVGVLNAARPDPARLNADAEDSIRWLLNEFQHAMKKSIVNDMRDFMRGDPNNVGQTLIGILGSEYFFRRDENIQSAVMDMSEQMMIHNVINALWAYERSYIVWSDVQFGYCNYDNRGPVESRVCLDEHPTSVYYMYALDVSREYDSGTRHKALIHGPTGYRNFIGRNPAYGVTKEDIVRSSIFVHENGLHDKINNLDRVVLAKALGLGQGQGSNHGKFPGSFRLPISRNPGGEAISSVWEEHARNYPCMSGEFGWNDGTWRLELDQTFDFLVHTGLMFSEDWEDFCHHNGHCHGQDSIDWHSRFEALRKPGDPQIPKSLKHPFKKCKQKTDHGPGSPSYDFSANPPI
jgi:hypothetical protein